MNYKELPFPISFEMQNIICIVVMYCTNILVNSVFKIVFYPFTIMIWLRLCLIKTKLLRIYFQFEKVLQNCLVILLCKTPLPLEAIIFNFLLNYHSHPYWNRKQPIHRSPTPLTLTSPSQSTVCDIVWGYRWKVQNLIS